MLPKTVDSDAIMEHVGEEISSKVCVSASVSVRTEMSPQLLFAVV